MQTTNPYPADPPATPEYLSLGPAPRPASGAELTERLLGVLRAQVGPEVIGLDRVRIDATMVGTGPDVATLDVDLSGVTVPLTGVPEGGGPPDDDDWTPQVVSRETGRVGRLRLDAHPVTVVDLPVDLGVELDGLPFAWVEGADGNVGVEAVEPTSDTPVTGHARLAVPKDGLVATARGVLTVVLAQQGITLTDLDLDVVSEGPRAVRLRAKAAVKKGMFLAAGVTATASAAVDEDLVLVIGDVSLSSGNPLVAALLTVVRSRVEAVSNQRIDLAEHLPAGVRVADVRLDVGRDLVLTARLA
ncbi:hypothetical protein [Antribacter gilvus]|uniref:hypothetical protein n=1 Tax=Antribacter gilvus TaxID=2304675 RepID=UPI000F771C1C|nr:hypothetical protein [Antribacter gilvus]